MQGSPRIESRRLPQFGRVSTCWAAYLALSLLLWHAGARCAHAAIQFDVFLGYDGIVPVASWFPVVCEVRNDGPSFTGTVEVSGGNFSPGQTRRTVVELPTGTLKRLVIPVFSTTSYNNWDVRLLDERGKTRAEQIGLRPKRQIASRVPVLGAVARTPGGTPSFLPTKVQQPELQPVSARLLPSIFPDNPLVLEGMDCLYLNSGEAIKLAANQAEALLGWLNAGGHLIVGVEQVSDVTGTPWLNQCFPCALKDMQTVRRHPEFQDWLRTASGPAELPFTPPVSRPGKRAPASPRYGMPTGNAFSDLPEDFTFEAAEMQVACGTLRDGRPVISADEVPLMVTANRSRGRITVLLFSPEREPFRSWRNLPAFWAKLAEVPGGWYLSSDFRQAGGWSSDGIFGAMIDSRQVHKLPIGWLLLLLIVYLVVIGPLDQYWLKRIGKPMLTWITFPCYVLLFSLVIYFIGYKLRAGESEWNELHLVDVLLHGDRAELRGRTYSSVYSPSNQRYTLESQQKFAAIRGEFAGVWSGGQSSEKASVVQNGDNFKAEIFVPVWSSQLYVSDWWQPAAVPLNVTITPEGGAWQVKVENRTDRKMTDAQLAIDGYLIGLGELPPGQTTRTVTKSAGIPLGVFVSKYGVGFQQAVQSRRQAFGASESGRISDVPNAALAASFLSQMGQQQNYMSSFTAPPGLDMSSVMEHGNAILLAWAADYSPIKPMYQFTPRRSHRDTLWRVPVAVQ